MVHAGICSVWQQDDSFQWHAPVHFASDRRLAGDLLHAIAWHCRLAGYGVAYVKQNVQRVY